MKNLPSYLSKLRHKTSRWEKFQEIEGKAEAESAAESLLHKKMDLTPKNFELEEEALEDGEKAITKQTVAKKQPDMSHDKELLHLGKRITGLKKEIKNRIASVETKKTKLANYKEKSPTARPEREMKKIAKRAQTSLVETRFTSKTKDGKTKRALISKTLSKEKTLKKMKKKVAVTRDPPSYH